MLHIEKFSHFLTDIPFNRALGLKIKSIENDYISMCFSMKPELVGNFIHGILHGGVISSVLDMAGGAATMIAFIKKHASKDILELTEQLGKTGTINLHVDYLRPGKGNEFTAKAEVLRSGNKITVTRMELFNEASVLIASATGTYMVG